MLDNLANNKIQGGHVKHLIEITGDCARVSIPIENLDPLTEFLRPYLHPVFGKGRDPDPAIAQATSDLYDEINAAKMAFETRRRNEQ